MNFEGLHTITEHQLNHLIGNLSVVWFFWNCTTNI